MKFIHITSPEQSIQRITSPEKIAFFVYNFSGHLNIDIAHEDAEVYIFGLFIGRHDETFNIQTTQHHSTGKNISNLFIKGIFFDSAKFTYEGLIKIDKGSQLSNAYQKNQNLIMSPTAFVDSRPFLEIEANDVRCTHGSTTGRLNQDQLTYLQLRGISPEQAQNLLIEGFVTDLFNTMQIHLPKSTVDPLKKACLEALA